MAAHVISFFYLIDLEKFSYFWHASAGVYTERCITDFSFPITALLFAVFDK